MFAPPLSCVIIIQKELGATEKKEGIFKLISNKQRNFLRATGHELHPEIIVGKNGVTEPVVEQLKLALKARELVKGRVLPHTEFEVREVANLLAGRTGADVVLTVGRNFLLYLPPLDGAPSKLPWPEED